MSRGYREQRTQTRLPLMHTIDRHTQTDTDDYTLAAAPNFDDLRKEGARGGASRIAGAAA